MNIGRFPSKNPHEVTWLYIRMVRIPWIELMNHEVLKIMETKGDIFKIGKRSDKRRSSENSILTGQIERRAGRKSKERSLRV